MDHQCDTTIIIADGAHNATHLGTGYVVELGQGNGRRCVRAHDVIVIEPSPGHEDKHAKPESIYRSHTQAQSQAPVATSV